MTALLQQAFQAASRLSPAEPKIASTGEKLARLSREAMAAYHAGKTEPLDIPDE